MVAIFTSTRWPARVLIRSRRSRQSSKARGHRMKAWLRSLLSAQYGHVGGIFIPDLQRLLRVGRTWWVSNHNSSLSRLLDLLCQIRFQAFEKSGCGWVVFLHFLTARGSISGVSQILTCLEVTFVSLLVNWRRCCCRVVTRVLYHEGTVVGSA